MANQRKGVPAGWTWRDGRPRWIPSPALRAHGWKGKDLKDPLGRWLDRGASITAAQAMVEAVAAWRRGDTPFNAPAPIPAAADALSIGVLIDAYLASDELALRKDGSPRPPATAADYRRKLKRLVDTLAGYVALPDPKDKAAMAAYSAATARVRAFTVFALAPEDRGDTVRSLLYDAYRKLQRHSGVHMAFGVMSCASAWLNWCRRHRNTAIGNWAGDVARETPRGRIRIATFPELAALVTAADDMGLQAVGDAILLSLALSWSQTDILSLTWDRIVRDDKGVWRAHTGQVGRIKTGRIGGTPILSIGVRRLQAMRERTAGATVQPLRGRVIVLPRQRTRANLAEGADSHFIRKLFRQVRDEAVKTQPTLADFTYADLRDTSDTLALRGGLNDQQRAGRNLRSLKNNNDLSDRHYGEIGPEITAAGHDLLDPYVEAELRKHGVTL